MVKNSNLRNAKKAKKDEFYTQLSDIEKELVYYENFFENKIVYCNCDDPSNSNFFIYFENNFLKLKLKKLIVTGFSIDNFIPQAVVLENVNGEIKRSSNLLFGDDNYNAGDFRSSECIEYLKEADVIVTNPPFSLFREYVAKLVEHNKRFLILGNQNAIICKEIFPLIKNNELWLGKTIHSGDRKFNVPDDYPLEAVGCGYDENGKKFVQVTGVRWFTNIEYNKQYKDLLLKKEYNEIDYPKFDNYDAINVGKTREIPVNYDGVMGVPITFLDKYNPKQFEILGLAKNNGIPKVKEKNIFARILIKRKHNKNEEISC